MRNKGPGRVAALLICAFLLLGQFGPFALAYAEPDDSFTIRITPLLRLHDDYGELHRIRPRDRRRRRIRQRAGIPGRVIRRGKRGAAFAYAEAVLLCRFIGLRTPSP